MSATLPIKKMTRAEKLMAMEALWADLSQDESKLDSPAWHGEMLQDAERQVKSGKARFMDWEKAKAMLRRKASRAA